MSQTDFLRRIVSILRQGDVPYMLVGSLASSLHGLPRATQDIDIVIDPTDAALSDMLNQFPPDRYYVDAESARDALAHRGQFNVVDLTTGWKADFVIRKLRRFSEEELRRRLSARIQGVNINVASAEDTVLSKLEWAAMGESERQLRDATGIIAVQGDRLDRTYIEKWVRVLGVEELWRHALDLAKGA